jgi:hypothetical protein
MYSEVNEVTSSGNVSQQVTSVYNDIDEFVGDYDYADIGHAVGLARPRFIHINSTIVRCVVA